jgi:hypothetical protein
MSGLVFLTVWWGQEANDLLHGPAFHVDRVVGASNVGHRAVGLIEMKDKGCMYYTSIVMNNDQSALTAWFRCFFKACFSILNGWYVSDE